MSPRYEFKSVATSPWVPAVAGVENHPAGTGVQRHLARRAADDVDGVVVADAERIG